MDIYEVRQGIEQGMTLIHDMPLDFICRRWDDLGVNAVKNALFTSTSTAALLQDRLARLIGPLRDAQQNTLTAQQKFDQTSEGTGNMDMLDIVANTMSLAEDTHKLADAVTVMEEKARRVNAALSEAMIALGELASIYDAVEVKGTPGQLLDKQPAIITCAEQYLESL